MDLRRSAVSVAREAAAAAAVVAALTALAGCSDAVSPSGTPSAAATSATPGPAGALDACLVGTWRSSGVTATLTIGGAKVPVTGGAGEVLTIDSAGTIRTDESNTAPVRGAAPDGTQYVLSQTGVATGRISGGGGKLSVSIDQPTTLTVTLLKNGSQVQTQHPGSANDSYTCTPRSALVITGGGGTVTTYAPS
jgi:hypothetical protein